MFTKALVPLDGTEISEGIVPFVTQFARGLEMGVVLAKAIETDPTGGGPLNRLAAGLSELSEERLSAQAHLRESIEREERKRLDELADRMALEGVAAESAVGFGPASETIIRMAQESGCDLIAMSTRGRSVLGSGLLGSVTYKTMHQSPMPVLAITPERAGGRWDTDFGISRIIVPLDGSEFAEAALPYAAAIAGRMNMSMTLLQALSVDSLIYSDGYAISDVISQVEDEIRAEARRYLYAIARQLRGEGIDVGVEIVQGRASSEIADMARATSHNMIALATHGRSGMSRLLLGSVAEAVVRESGDPVLIVRPSTS